MQVAKMHEYCLVSLSNVVATTCQYEALKYVSFPVQTLGKCAKMIPVMIWGSIIMRRSYTAQKYLIAALVRKSPPLPESSRPRCSSFLNPKGDLVKR